MSVASKTSLLDVDDFWAMVKDGQKADLIDGVVDRASPDSGDRDDGKR